MKITEVVCQILRIPNVQAKTVSQDFVLVRNCTDNGLEGIPDVFMMPVLHYEGPSLCGVQA